MIAELQEPNWKSTKTLLVFQSHYSNPESSMEVRTRNPNPSPNSSAMGTNPIRRQHHQQHQQHQQQQWDSREREYGHRSSFSSNVKKTPLRSSSGYFSLESMLLLVCLTASLLILPLILPPLPPPPFLLLLLPIAILVLLMFLAFMPSNVRDLTYTYM